MSSHAPKIPSFQAQVSIRNLGAIREAELNLRPLTVLFGHNGVNKTWAAYSVYAALQQRPSLPDELPASVVDALKRFADAVRVARTKAIERAKSGNFDHSHMDAAGLSVTVPVRADLSLLAGTLAPHLHCKVNGSQIAGILAVDLAGFESASVCLQQISNGRSVFELSGHTARVAVGTGEPWEATGDSIVAVPDTEQPMAQAAGVQFWQLVFEDTKHVDYLNAGYPVDFPIPLERLVAETTLKAMGRFWRAVNGAIPLPAERKTLAALYRDLVAVSAFRTRERGREQGEGSHRDNGHGLSAALEDGKLASLLDESPLPTPCLDLVRWLSKMHNISAKALAFARRCETVISGLGRTVSEIVGGQMTFSEPTAMGAALGYGAGPLVFRFGNGKELPFHAAASVARSLGLLDIWLRENAQPGDLVLIDEPEMNAHPESQVKIAELLAMMANAGLRVIITTHSPYLVEHLEGLMLGSRLKPEVRAQFVSRLGLKNADAFLDPQDLAVYHFEEQADGEVKVFDVLDREECAIDWMTFSRPIAKIGNLINNIMAELGRQDESPQEEG